MQYDTVFAEWLGRRRISAPVLKDFKVHAGEHPTLGECIVIPVYNAQGIFSFNKYRRNPIEDVKPKYLYDKGGIVQLYGADKLKDVPEGNVVIWCEGEMDALVAWSHNIPAVTSTGGSMSMKSEWRELLTGFDVVLCFDNDTAGADGMVKALEIVPWARIMFLPDRPGVKDISDYVTSGGDLHDLLKTARRYDSEAEVMDDRGVRAAHWQSTFFHDAYLEKAQAKRVLEARPKNYSVAFAKHADRIVAARQVPIGTFVTFDSRNKAPCVWHKEKTGSMHWYRESNRVYCFGCGKSGDAIDVYRARHSCSFTTAINALAAQ